MSLADPQTVTVNGASQTMPRVESTGRKSIYRKNDDTFVLTVSHTPIKTGGKDRIRSMARIDQKAIVENPLTAVNDFETLSVYTVIDRPLAGFTSTQLEHLLTGFNTWLDDTMMAKLFGQES